MFPFKKKEFFNQEQQNRIVEAIREAELLTSGEIRLFVESKCRFVDPLHRSMEVFASLNMQKTRHRNAVILYVALRDKQFAIYGDEGIHQKVGDDYWSTQAHHLKQHFKEGKVVEGICQCIREIGASLQKHFPHESDGTNELPDNIVFGK
ncbi:MAG: TPM domain-containing protein [Chitinophagaceae bacterium]